MGFGPPGRFRKKGAPGIGPEIGPAGKKAKKKNGFPGFELFFFLLPGGANFRTNLGSYFFPIFGRRPKPIFYQVGRFQSVDTF